MPHIARRIRSYWHAFLVLAVDVWRYKMLMADADGRNWDQRAGRMMEEVWSRYEDEPFFNIYLLLFPESKYELNISTSINVFIKLRRR